MKIEKAERRALASAAHVLVRDEAFIAAAKHVEDNLTTKILKGETADAREASHHEYRGLVAVIKRLATLSGEWAQHIEAEQDETK